MNKALYLYCIFAPSFLIAAEYEKYVSFPQETIAAIALGKIHSLGSNFDFKHLCNVYAGDTIRTPAYQPLPLSGNCTNYSLEGNNFITTPSVDGKYIFHTMSPGVVQVVQTYQSYNRTVRCPFLLRRKSYKLNVRNHEPIDHPAKKSCLKK